MKDGLILLLFIVTLPALIALGHDVYLFYLTNQDVAQNLDITGLADLYTQDTPGRSFHFASFGFLWTHYAPDNFHETVQSMGQENWEQLRPYLSWQAFPTLGIFAAAVYALTGLAFLVKRPKRRRFR
ncbi:MAG: hypothetical protein LRY54_02525 [Alphaproteobacteria bacterium]|nr:hypothetical protein [Alphaproteobacteria bacterium]